MAKAKAPNPKPSGDIEALWTEYWKTRDDAQLRIYADALEQAADPRGTFIQLSMLESRTPEQEAARERLLKKSKGDLVGPARTFLREVDFAANGLVFKARAEAGKVMAGISEVSRVHPQLILTITSMKPEALAKQFGKISLRDIYFVDFGWLTGTHGGCRLSDKLLAAITPALAEVERLQLSFSGADNSPTVEGMRVFGQHAKKLRFLAADYHVDGGCAPAADYAAAIRDGFPELKAVEWPSMSKTDLPKLKVNAILDANNPDDANGSLRSDTAQKVDRVLA